MKLATRRRRKFDGPRDAPALRVGSRTLASVAPRTPKSSSLHDLRQLRRSPHCKIIVSCRRRPGVALPPDTSCSNP